MHSLPVFLRLTDRPVMLIGTGAAADAKRRLLARAGALVVDEADSGARIAIVAVEDEAEADAAAARLKARGLLVNVTDRPALCDFTLPAIVDRDPVIVAIGTGGASAGLAAALRQRLEAIIPARIGQLARDLFAARAQIKAAWPDAGNRRRALAAAFRAGGSLDPFGETPDLPGWLTTGGAHSRSDTITIVLTSTDPDEMSLRAARLLAEADRVLHAADIPAAILARARADAELIPFPPEMPAPPDQPGLTLILRITAQITAQITAL